jgi:calcineurin-like phosphoesterase family protein
MRKFDKEQKLFITSDEHYGHFNMIRICDRPYTSVGDMDQALIHNHNSIVSNDDITIHLGDFIWKGHNFNHIVYQLNGFHIFIRGNHDHSYPSKQIADTNTDKYVILENQIFEFEYLKKYFVACHYPMIEWNQSFRGSVHLYGHTHKVVEGSKNSYHVGVDTNNWQPVEVSKFVGKIL